ncbi:MAG TPA: cell wall hydrolase [Caulobacteraceae bacterium]
MLFSTRAATLALLLNVGVILGLLFGAVAFAGAAIPLTARAKAYAAAAQSGYDQGVPPRPIIELKTVPAEGTPAQEPVAKLEPTPGALNCLSAAIYFEARGESADGRAAVAQVVLNRTRRAEYPHSICGVVYQGAAQGACQFSFVCNGAMHGRREQDAWLDARRIAAKALAGHVMTAVGQAISFRAARGPAPSGAVRLGGHLFFT